MKLARALGYVNVDAMLGSITLPQLLEWADFNEIDPFVEERADLRTAKLEATIINALRGKKGRAITPKDCMPQFGKPSMKPQKSGEQMAAIFASFAAAHNEALKRGG